MSDRLRAITPLVLALSVALVACTAQDATEDEMPRTPVMESGAREEQLQAAQAQAGDLFHDRFPDQLLPDAILIRAVAPSEWAEATAACMTDAGFESHVEGLSVETVAFPAEQELAQVTAVYQCRVSYPIDPVYQQPYSTDEAQYLYSHLVASVVPCLEGEGYSISDVPSAGTFQDQLSTGREWSPFESVNPGSEEQYASLMSTCPEKPAGFRGN